MSPKIEERIIKYKVIIAEPEHMVSRHVENAMENLGFKQWVQSRQRQCNTVVDEVTGEKVSIEEYEWYMGIFENDKYNVTIYELGDTDKMLITKIVDGKRTTDAIDDHKNYTIKEGLIRLKELMHEKVA